MNSQSTDFYFYEPASGHGLKHDPFNAIVGPRPIGWISTVSASGHVNLAPYSFFNAFNYVPPIIGFSSVGYKDTLRNIEETRQFVWNLATRQNAEAMNQTSAAVPAEVNEFELAKLEALASVKVKPPRVKSAPVSFECQVTQVLQLQTTQQQLVPTWLVLGEVVGVHIRSALIASGVYDTAAASPILRAGGPADYFSVGVDQLFKMERPK